MNQDKIILLVLLVIAIILFVAIFMWENREMKLVENCKSIEDISEEEKLHHLQDLACYPYTTKVLWRGVVIETILATFVIYIFLYKKFDVKITDILIIGFIILAILMAMGLFQTFHYDRVVCQKAAPQAPWFQRLAHDPESPSPFKVHHKDLNDNDGRWIRNGFIGNVGTK
jgi:hypothetical protein